MRDGTVTAIEKTGLPEKIGMCLGNGCFIAGTLVTTRSGFKPIEEIKIGDYVLSRNEETGEMQIWSRSEAFFKKNMETLLREYNNSGTPLTDIPIKIIRKGARGDTQTTYTFIPQPVHPFLQFCVSSALFAFSFSFSRYFLFTPISMKSQGKISS